RPMSQRKDTMPVVARDSGAEDRLVRPLCARNLPATLAEKEGWLDRDRLYAFSGRSRKPQMALAKQFGFEDYAQPAGGCCFLTDKQYSVKLSDLWSTRGKREYDLDDIMLLKVGRHLRPRPNFKIIVGREEGENRFLEGYRKRFTHMVSSSHTGPLVLLDGEDIKMDDLELAARLTARFGQGRDAELVTVEVHDKGVMQTMAVVPMQTEQIPADWYL
ncbi:MAG: tRNA (5-methylaminomethyl-2-thiouridylate)-methyltransferase, partial [Gammaproteobacteria bacterium]|nr:tRNA (5-methylaminomethyl-2-thiouridylate)-methyltransferase [Gammaproteobacteria bacterium]